MKISQLIDCVEKSNAIRRIRHLQPIGGEGSYVAPPTYLDSNKKPIHVFEKRRIAGKDTQCVLLDSVQSQANRFEEALSNALRVGELAIPDVQVDFRGAVEGVGIVSSLRSPHRIFDAIIRDSKLDEIAFPKTEIGKDIDKATPRNALALFRFSPTTLIFGGWNSTGDRGGNGPRFQRCIVSEIIGINVPVITQDDKNGQSTTIPEGKKPSSRIDPLEIEKAEIFKSSTAKSEWSLSEFSNSKKAKPSDVLHGNIPPQVTNQGVTIDRAQQITTITLAGIRKLSFPDETGETTHDRDMAAWTTLVALALCAVTENDKNGYALRSRCDLYPKSSKMEVVHNNGDTDEVDIAVEDSKKLLDEAATTAKEHGLPWVTEPTKLLPQEKLVNLIKKSRSVIPH